MKLLDLEAEARLTKGVYSTPPPLADPHPHTLSQQSNLPTALLDPAVDAGLVEGIVALPFSCQGTPPPRGNQQQSDPPMALLDPAVDAGLVEGMIARQGLGRPVLPQRPQPRGDRHLHLRPAHRTLAVHVLHLLSRRILQTDSWGEACLTIHWSIVCRGHT